MGWMTLDRQGDVVRGEMGGIYLTHRGITTWHCNGIGAVSGSKLAFPRLSGSPEQCTYFDGTVRTSGRRVQGSDSLVFSSVSTGVFESR